MYTFEITFLNYITNYFESLSTLRSKPEMSRLRIQHICLKALPIDTFWFLVALKTCLTSPSSEMNCNINITVKTGTCPIGILIM